MTDTTPGSMQHNLLDLPWLAVLDENGAEAEVSLLDAFARASRLQGLVGELPTMAFAHLRLLLAILHRALSDPGVPGACGPTDARTWAARRDDWEDTAGGVTEYLEAHRDRFWLVHPTAPFFQVAGLEAQNGELKEPATIIADGPGNSPYLTTRIARGRAWLGWPEAARWLVHAHAYDVSGIHAGAVGDPRVKGGKGYPIGTGWAGQIGGVYAVGGTLRDTLMLNLVVATDARLSPDPDREDLPPWERAPLTASPEGWLDGETSGAYREPTGQVDLYTWQARRIRLVGDDDGVTGVVNAQGDRATPQSREHLEPLTSWRHAEPQSKKFKRTTYMPLEHDPARVVWRGMEALLPHATPRTTKTGESERLPPGLAYWLGRLEGDRLLDGGLIRFRTVGATYESNQTQIGAIADDQLELPGSLLRADSAGLAQVAVDAVDQARRAVDALGYLVKDLALASGSSPDAADGPRGRAVTGAYGALDGPYRAWLRGLGEPGSTRASAIAWQQTVRDVLFELAREELGQAGPAAVVGRTVSGRFTDAGRAEKDFRRRLADVLPHGYRPTTTDDATEAA